MAMKQVIRLTESDLHQIVKDTVQRILRENAWGKYPAEDQNNAMLDMNMNDRTDGEWADAYKRNDPMVKNIHGSTLRDMMNGTLGNDIHPS
jgi:hypothetical protein